MHEDTLTKREELFKNYLDITEINAEPVLLTYEHNETVQSIFDVIMQEKPEYDFCINLIYKELDEAMLYQDLKMSTIYSIYLFSSIDMYKTDVYDIRWGGNLFLEDEDLKIDTL